MRALVTSAILLWLACPFICPSSMAGTPNLHAKKLSPASSVDLSAAQELENLGEWDKAEEVYLQSWQSASGASRQQIVKALARVIQKRKQEKLHAALSAAASLENSQHWTQAEQIYIDAMKSGPAAL